MTTPEPQSPTADRDALDLGAVAARAAEVKGGTDIVVLDVAGVCSFCEVFVLATGRSDRQVKAITDHVEDEARRHRGTRPLRVEGRAHGEWVVLDYGDVVVHLFDEQTRAFYSLERLWSDGIRLEWEPAGVQPAG